MKTKHTLFGRIERLDPKPDSQGVYYAVMRLRAVEENLARHHREVRIPLTRDQYVRYQDLLNQRNHKKGRGEWEIRIKGYFEAEITEIRHTLDSISTQ